MRSLFSVSLRWFVAVSLVVTLIYLLSMSRGVLSTKEQWGMKAGIAAMAAMEASARLTISNFYFSAEYLSQESKVTNLMAQAQLAVSRFGRASAQAKAVRQAMYEEVILPRLFTSRIGYPELVRFYLSPGAVSFLTISHDSLISQTSAKPNAIAAAAFRRLQAVVGFTYDDHSVGLRAVVPVWAQESASGERRVVGFVELGLSLDSLFKDMFATIKGGEGEASAAVLLPIQDIKEKMNTQGWPSLPKFRTCQDGYAVIQTTNPLIQRICNQHNLKEFLDEKNRYGTSYMELDGKNYILFATRLGAWNDENGIRDSLSKMGIPMFKEGKTRSGKAIMLMWMPVEPWTQSVWHFLKKHPIQVGSGLAVILTVIFLAWGLANTQLRKLVNRRTDELAQTNRELALAKDRAEQASQAKSSFLASMSHEIRTPLNVVVGLADMTMGDDLDRDRQENLRAIKDSSRHLLSIINDILDFSKIEAGRVELESLNFDLHELMRSTVQTFHNSAAEKGLSLNLRVDPSTPVYVKGDPMRLRQVLNNLLSNALKFTSQGGVSLSVRRDGWGTASSQDATIRLLFGIKDTGEGVPPEMREKIFDSFRQADGSTSRRFGGTGLGLAICRQLVEMMGGGICVESKQGQGSEFIFTAVFREVTPDGVVEAQEESAEKPAAVAKGVILLVEDNVMNQKVGMAMLGKHGLEVVAAQNGKDAIEKMRNGQFDLVLMDVEMPVMDGIEAARRIRAGEAGKEHMHVPILALTAHALADIQSKCIQAGMNDFLSKPLDYVRLANLIQDILAKRFVVLAKALPRVLDKQRALERLGGSQELYESACAMFAEDIPQRIGLMRHALEEDNLGALQGHAHHVKGAANTLGATLVGSLAESLELAARDRNNAEARDVFRLLEPVLTDLAKVLSAPDNG